MKRGLNGVHPLNWICYTPEQSNYVVIGNKTRTVIDNFVVAYEGKTIQNYNHFTHETLIEDRKII